MSCLRQARSTVCAIGFLGLVLVTTPAATAQATDAVAPGARIRVKLSSHGTGWMYGQLLMLSPDSAAIILTETSDSIRFANAAAERAEVSQGRHARTGKGARLGLLIGAGTGLILGLAASAEDCTEFCPVEVGTGEILAASALLGGVGAGIGGFIGSLSHEERWSPVVLPPRSSARSGIRTRTQLGITLRF